MATRRIDPSTDLHTFKARIEEPGNGVFTKTIEAAYFQEDPRYTVFKDANNQAVYSVRHDSLLSVERVQLAGGSIDVVVGDVTGGAKWISST